MPYLHCPACRLTTFSAAGHATHDACPRCGAELVSRPRRFFRPPGDAGAAAPEATSDVSKTGPVDAAA